MFSIQAIVFVSMRNRTMVDAREYGPEQMMNSVGANKYQINASVASVHRRKGQKGHLARGEICGAAE